MKRPLRLLKWLGFAVLLLAAAVVLAALLVVQTEAGSRWAVNRALGRVNAMEGVSVAYESLSGTLVAGLEIEGLEAVLPAEGGSHRIALDALAFQWNPFLLADSLLRVTRLDLRGLEVALAPSRSEEPADVRAILDKVFSLPLDFAVDEASLRGFTLDMENLQLAAEEISARDLSLDNARLRGGELRWRSETYEAAASAVELQAAGFALAGELDWRLTLENIGLAGEARLGGSLEELRLEHRLLSPLVVQSDGTLSPGVLENRPPAFDLVHTVEGLSGPIPGFDLLEAASGRLATRGAIEQVTIAGELQLGLRDLDPFAIGLDAVWDGEGLEVAGLDVENALVDFSASGRLDVSPALSLQAEWAVNRLDPSPYLPQVSLEAVQGNGAVSLAMEEGSLSADLDLVSLTGRLNGYALDASGRLALADGRPDDFTLAVQAQDNALRLEGSLQPALDVSWQVDAPALRVFLPELRGAVNGSGTFEGTLEEPIVSGSLGGESLAYRLGGKEYALESFALRANYRRAGGDNRLDFNLSNLRLPLGETPYVVNAADLQLSGEPEDHVIGLEAEVQSESVLLSARGGFEAGVWRGQLNQAGLISDYGNWELDAATPLLVSAERASIGAHCWSFLQIDLCGEAGWAAEEGYEATLRLSGLPLALLNSAETVSRLEDPELTRRLRDKPIGLATLQERFSLRLPAQAFVDGVVDLEASVTSSADSTLPLIEARLSPRGLRLGLLVEQESESQTLQPRVQVFGFDEVDLSLGHRAGLWEGAAGFAVHREGEESAPLGRLEGNVSLDAADKLNGEVSIDFTDVAWVDTLVPLVGGTHGELEARAEIGGTLERPQLLADLSLADGGFQIEEYGLDIHDLELMVHSAAGNEITLSGSALSGEGKLALNGRVTAPLLDSRRLSLQIRGEDFQVMNLDDTQAVISPALDLTLTGDRLDVRGEVGVPHFLLDLEESEVVAARGGGVQVSRDVVVVEAPPEQQALLESNASAEAVRRIAVTGAVTVNLGEDVRFSGYGLNIQLGGELTIEKEAARPVLAYGEISVLEGTYESYGQELSAEGKLIFLGNPLNPALDMRAFREVENATVGVQMSGTLRNIQGQLYSTPVLPESEILAILVTGKSFQNVGPQDSDSLLAAIANFGIERGQGITDTVRGKLGLDTLEVSGGSSLEESSLGLGKYITPDLFLRYDVGLFDRQSSLSLNYALTDRLRLEVQTGVSQSVDLTYTVEK